MFSAFAAFLDDGDEVIVMEPYFDQVKHLHRNNTNAVPVHFQH
jgi:aspartate/methionine/tyrosine aminotransferase